MGCNASVAFGPHVTSVALCLAVQRVRAKLVHRWQRVSACSLNTSTKPQGLVIYVDVGEFSQAEAVNNPHVRVASPSRLITRTTGLRLFAAVQCLSLARWGTPAIQCLSLARWGTPATQCLSCASLVAW